MTVARMCCECLPSLLPERAVPALKHTAAGESGADSAYRQAPGVTLTAVDTGSGGGASAPEPGEDHRADHEERP